MSPVSNAVAFTVTDVLPPPPVVTNVTPVTLPELWPTEIDVAGQNLTTVTEVVLISSLDASEYPCTDISALSDTVVRCNTAPLPGQGATPVPYAVRVTNPGGSDTLDAASSVDPTIWFDNVYPVMGPTAGGTVLGIYYSAAVSNHGTVSGVSIGGVPATGVQSNPGNNWVEAVTPPNPIGPADIVLEFSNAIPITAPDAFEYSDAETKPG